MSPIFRSYICMIKCHHQVDISEHCCSTASIFLIKRVISNSFSQQEKFVFFLVHIHSCQGDGIPPSQYSPPPPFHTSKIKDEKNRECGGECGELEGVLSPSTGIHIWLSKVNSSSRLPRHIKMLYLVIHASMKVKALQKNIHNRRYR